MPEIIITVENLGKKYSIRHQRKERYTTLRDVLADKARSLFRNPQSAIRHGSSEPFPTHEDFWALKNVSFEVRQGEVLGIIGRNGAGKSTLLKILSRITEPTEGKVQIKGRVASLLEVGTGFHPELTGRENIFLNGAILGMARTEIKDKFDEIVAFAEIEKFLDTPVKRYSSGMYVRLAFAVAAHLEPEILVVDEVLAVGDAEFQKKCLGKMEQVSQTEGRTVLFVSHNMATIQRLCRHGLFLERGHLRQRGTITEVVTRYHALESTNQQAQFDVRNRSGRGWARVITLRLVDEQNQAIAARPADADLIFEIGLSVASTEAAKLTLRGLVLELIFQNEQGQPLTSVMNADDGGIELPGLRACCVRMRLGGPTFIPGRYRVKVFLGIPFLQHVDEIPDALSFEILPPSEPWRPYDISPATGHVCRKAEWELCQRAENDIPNAPATRYGG